MKKQKEKWRKNIIEIVSAIRYCWQLSWDASRKCTIIRMLCASVPSLINFYLAWLTKGFLDILIADIAETEKITKVSIYLVLFLLIRALNILLGKGLSFYQQFHEELISKNVTTKIMDTAMNVDLQQYDNSEFYDQLNSCIGDSFALCSLIWKVMTLGTCTITVIVAVAAISKTSVWYGGIIVLSTIPLIIARWRYTKEGYKLRLSQMTAERKKAYLLWLTSQVDTAKSIRVCNAQEFIQNKYSAIWKETFDKNNEFEKKSIFRTGVWENLPEIASIGILGGIAMGIINGENTIGDYTLYTSLLTQVSTSMISFWMALTQINDNRMRIQNYFKLINYENETEGKGKEHISEINTIEFREVVFSYPYSKEMVLNNVSFTIKKGETVALVGKNGSGKSTIVKLLLRLYDVNSGAIYINGKDIREYSTEELRRCFSVYFQNEKTYNFTIKENFEFSNGGKNCNDEKIKDLLVDLDGAEILKKTKNDLNKSLSKMFDTDGIELSGGQYQKIAIARALFRQHSVLILDEASSNLDKTAERALIGHVQTADQKNIVILISHHERYMELVDKVVEI